MVKTPSFPSLLLLFPLTLFRNMKYVFLGCKGNIFFCIFENCLYCRLRHNCSWTAYVLMFPPSKSRVAAPHWKCLICSTKISWTQDTIQAHLQVWAGRKNRKNRGIEVFFLKGRTKTSFEGRGKACGNWKFCAP